METHQLSCHVTVKLTPTCTFGLERFFLFLLFLFASWFAIHSMSSGFLALIRCTSTW